ncbi:MAG: hypothetical protein H7Y10_10490 [Flavobacterium sp.]|nr:hypothetical protein [Flavobacterium sp.]
MHNLKTNFDKTFGIAKCALSDVLLEDDNFFNYRNKRKMTDIEIVTLAFTTESLGIDSENPLFSKLRNEFLTDFSRLPYLSNYNRRRKRLQDYMAWISEFMAKTISPEENQFILDYRYVRKRIETLLSQMRDQLYLKRNYAKTVDGLFARMCTKMSSVAALQFINFTHGKPINHLKHALAN